MLWKGIHVKLNVFFSVDFMFWVSVNISWTITPDVSMAAGQDRESTAFIDLWTVLFFCRIMMGWLTDGRKRTWRIFWNFTTRHLFGMMVWMEREKNLVLEKNIFNKEKILYRLCMEKQNCFVLKQIPKNLLLNLIYHWASS